MPVFRKILPLFLAAPLLVVQGNARAQNDTFPLTIKDHQFSPATLEVPAGKKFQLTVKNLGSTPEEFESDSLRREKIIPGGKEAVISIGPLKPGTYPFKGEFNPKTAQGSLKAQ